MIEFMELAKTCAPEVHVTTITAVVKHESNFKPFAININSKPPRAIFPKSREQAIEEVRKLQAKGLSFDAGYGQINSGNWRWLGITAESVFDPCTNLKAAQRVLVKCYEGASKTHRGESALHAALSCYNTGNYTNGIRNGYVAKVLAGAGLKVPALTDLPSTAPVQKPSPPPAQGTSQPAKPTSSNDAFTQPRQDAFALPRSDAFQTPRPARRTVGSITYHAPTR